MFNECMHLPGGCTLTGIKNGLFSYIDGIYESGRHGIAQSGLLGKGEQHAANRNQTRVAQALTAAQQNPRDLARAVCAACSTMSPDQEHVLQVQIGTRLSFGSALTVVNPVAGLGLSGAAVVGNMIGAARKGGGYYDILKAGQAGE